MPTPLRLSSPVILGINCLSLLMSAEAPVRITRLTRAMNRSETQLRKVLSRMCDLGFVRTVQGPRGGYLLNREPGAINLLDLLEGLDGPLPGDACLPSPSVCAPSNACPIRALNVEVRQLVVRRLGALTLEDLSLPDRSA
jgi:Rrf2 family protein